MEKSLEDLKAEALAGQWGGGRKLTFSEKCGAFAALYAGVSNKVVACAFGLAPQTVSKLSGCLEYDPEPYKLEVMEVADEHHRVEVVENKIMRDHNERRNPARHRHYNDVAREFEALGAEEFERRYYVERVVKRIILAKVQLRDGDKRSGNGIKGRRPYDPYPLDEDGDPAFEKMTNKQIMQWRRENPTRYRALFPDHFANGHEGFFGEADK